MRTRVDVDRNNPEPEGCEGIASWWDSKSIPERRYALGDRHIHHKWIPKDFKDLRPGTLQRVVTLFRNGPQKRRSAGLPRKYPNRAKRAANPTHFHQPANPVVARMMNLAAKMPARGLTAEEICQRRPLVWA